MVADCEFERIGFIGLGVMGAPMATNLLRAGFELFVCDRNPLARVALQEAGAQEAPTPAATAQAAQLVITMLPDTPDVEEVLFGLEGVVDGARNGLVVVDMSSSSPVATRRFASELAARGMALIDAPVSGGRAGAESGQLSIMAGGRADVFERCRPVLQRLGRTVVHLGESGAGQTTKACNQLLIACMMLGIAEAMTLAEKSGLDLAQVREVLMGGAAGSRLLELSGQRMLERAFDPGLRVTLHLKDLRAAFSAADELGVALPGTALASELLAVLRNTGRGHLDHAALIDVVRELSGVPTAKA